MIDKIKDMICCNKKHKVVIRISILLLILLVIFINAFSFLIFKNSPKGAFYNVVISRVLGDMETYRQYADINSMIEYDFLDKHQNIMLLERNPEKLKANLKYRAELADEFTYAAKSLTEEVFKSSKSNINKLFFFNCLTMSQDEYKQEFKIVEQKLNRNTYSYQFLYEGHGMVVVEKYTISDLNNDKQWKLVAYKRMQMAKDSASEN